jgi:hypothetical protein
VQSITSGRGPRSLDRLRGLPGPEAHLMCAHLHDPDHIHHLWVAALICILNIAMTAGVPIIGIQLLVIVGLFGRDAITILLS